MSLPEVHRVYLEDYIGIDTASPALRLVALMVCPPEQATEQVREILTNPAPLPMPREEWVGFIETILVYKLPRLTREDIKEMIGLQDIELKQTRFYQDVFQEGQEEGRQEGRQEGELTIILRLLGRRFATLPEPLVERLRQMDAGQLEAFSEVLLDARNLDDINDWLQKRQ